MSSPANGPGNPHGADPAVLREEKQKEKAAPSSKREMDSGSAQPHGKGAKTKSASADSE